ncbi:hypothetical protein C5B90_19215 [Haloferax sp. Atlit-12N]|nr:hypothetical protein C5B90_19215 [Haloferax sp. Atlit-12N]
MFDTHRRHLRRGGAGVGALAAVTWYADATEVALGLAVVAALALLVDSKLTESTWLPWGDE